LFRNSLRADQNFSEAKRGLEYVVAEMKKSQPQKTYVIGNSHTGIFRSISEVSVFWLGPVTMRRLGREGTDFLDYRDFGIKEESNVVAVFGEIDVRAHFMNLSDGSKNSIAETADDIVSKYLIALSKASKIAGLRCQIVASLIPPFREGIEVREESVGTVEQRVDATIAVNDRLRFGGKLLDFKYMDLYTPFADSSGTLAGEFTDDGFHIKDSYASFIAQELWNII